MKNNLTALMAMLLLTAICFVSCEKAYIAENDSEDNSTQEGYVKVTFNIGGFEQIPFDNNVNSSRAQTELRQVCTHIDFAIFDDSGKVKGINQKVDDDKLGTLSLSLPAGRYQVVIVAHSGAGVATISSPQEIKFKDNKITDTFYYYGVIDADNNSNYDITLRRAVAKFRLVISDKTPENVAQMKFYYTGGSSTFNAQTGFGCVNSRQTEIREVPASAYAGSSQYDIYTLPHITEDELKIVVSALDSSETAIYERTFSEVPVTVNQVTQYTGEFFGNQEQSQLSGDIKLSINDTWDNNNEYNY